MKIKELLFALFIGVAFFLHYSKGKLKLYHTCLYNIQIIGIKRKLV